MEGIIAFPSFVIRPLSFAIASSSWFVFIFGCAIAAGADQNHHKSNVLQIIVVSRSWSYDLGEVIMIQKSSIRDLRIWHEAVELALLLYRITSEFPKHELYGLTSQMRRAAVSIASNIAEGKGHFGGDFSRFLLHARGSLLELQTQILIARGLNYLDEKQGAELAARSDDLCRGLNGLIQAVRKTPRTNAITD